MFPNGARLSLGLTAILLLAELDWLYFKRESRISYHYAVITRLDRVISRDRPVKPGNDEPYWLIRDSRFKSQGHMRLAAEKLVSSP